ncbi:hypothetical protein D9M69_567220 [compost metagenome]
MSSLSLDDSRIRITIFSPNSVGSVETRKSTAFSTVSLASLSLGSFASLLSLLSFVSLGSAISSFMRPSCGTRFSEISSRDSTLMRVAILSRISSGGLATSCSTPSTRKRIR